MYRYSIIIPIYNAESTLDRCVNSLLSQNYKDAEIILINDGSFDASGEMCEKYACMSEQIKYISQKNCGVSLARNNGLSVASGEYILFVDSDDYVADDFFVQLDRLTKHDVFDLIVFSHVDCKNDSNNEVRYTPYTADTYERALNKISDLICKKQISNPWGKIYRNKIINKYRIEFPKEISIAEDRAFNIKYALHIKSLKVSGSLLYYVSLDNESSLSRKKKDNLKTQLDLANKDIIKAIDRCELSDSDKKIFLDSLNFGECRAAYTLAKTYWQENESLVERHKKIKQFCRSINVKNLTYPKTKYCMFLTLPVRLELVWVIDLIAWKLTH